jgi:5-hydroxyisourate hydrolase-like protein (transthyretin family)
MFTIKVIDQKSGKPAKDKKVAISLDGFFTGGISGTERTDSNGEVHFNYEPRSGKVYVEGKERHKGHLSGRVVIYI